MRALRMGEGVLGAPFVKFTLTFDGDLPSNGRPSDKWAIRKQFHTQLVELWRINPALRLVEKRRDFPKTWGTAYLEMHHSVVPQPVSFIKRSGRDAETIDLLEPIDRGGRKFAPLVRESLALKCGLKIVFLRKEEPGKVYQGGDLDNRIKTLFDALAVPNNDQVIDDPTLGPDPIYCLLEDDGLITAIDIETHQLLSRANNSKHDVSLIIHVDVRVIMTRVYNQPFLGD